MAVSWSPKLSVGVPSIDAQHQELFARVDALLAAMAEGQAKARVQETLDFLDRYVEEHFRDEAALMRRTRYPLLQQHLAIHAHFVLELRKLQEQLREEGDDVRGRVGVRTGFMLCEWLRTHVATSDRDLGEFLQTRDEPTLAADAARARLDRTPRA